MIVGKNHRHCYFVTNKLILLYYIRLDVSYLDLL